MKDDGGNPQRPGAKVLILEVLIATLPGGFFWRTEVDEIACVNSPAGSGVIVLKRGFNFLDLFGGQRFALKSVGTFYEDLDTLATILASEGDGSVHPTRD
jgi:hypothetical protein